MSSEAELTKLLCRAYELVYDEWDGCSEDSAGVRWMADARRLVPGIEGGRV